jgi:hypothetical protein
MARVDEAVGVYIEGIAAEHRPLFDRLHRLVLEAYPEAPVLLAYKMPAYKVGWRRLFLAAWKQRVSLCGWDQAPDGGFTARPQSSRRAPGRSVCDPAMRAPSRMTSSSA